MTLSVHIGGNLAFVLKPSTTPVACTRDYVEIIFDVSGIEPLDVANNMKMRAERVELEGKITLMVIACALLASGVTIKPKMLAALATATGKFEKLSRMVDGLTTPDNLRMLIQQLTDAPVTFGSARVRAATGDATV